MSIRFASFTSIPTSIKEVETRIGQSPVLNANSEASFSSAFIFPCPICGNPVVENEIGFGCANWRNGCDFTVWKNDKFIASLGKSVTKLMVELLLKNGKVGFRNIKSKKGTTYSAYLRYVRDEKTGHYKWEMDFID